ncbi:helix-turn-helix domain-containing transcriptional regulator [Enterobacter kobei]|uniref:helix-turn-helix domain-containing transcriptional regulator n=1 Tax=Enterobacter kobei TaxID=208224 RepID=UPI0007925E14|nr:hypothetical protein [Enterobacter kobei]SAF71666.1 addiction module antidote protein [Enterobacter kobei]
MPVANLNQTIHGTGTIAPAVDRDILLIEELRTDPDYAELYLKASLEKINEEDGLGGFLIALRRVLEARGDISESAIKAGLDWQSIDRALSGKSNLTITILAQLISLAGLKLTLSKASL